MKKRYSYLFTLSLLIFTTLFFVQCKKSDAQETIPGPKPHVGYSTTLWDKPADTLNYYLNGKWRVHFKKGGICGCKINREQYNEYYEFLPSQQIARYYYQNAFKNQWSYDWKTHQVHPLTPFHNVMVDKNSVPAPPLLAAILEPVRMVNDTLVINGICSYMPDNVEVFLTRE